MQGSLEQGFCLKWISCHLHEAISTTHYLLNSSINRRSVIGGHYRDKKLENMGWWKYFPNNAINSVHTIPLTIIFFPCQLLKLKQINLHLPGYWNGWKSGCRWICLSCYTCLMEAVHITVFHWHQEMQPGYKRNMKWFPNRQIHTRCPFRQVVSRFSWCWGKQTLYARSWREKHLQEILVGFPRKEIESRFDFKFDKRKLPPSYIVQKVYFCVEEMSQSRSKLFSAMLFKDFEKHWRVCMTNLHT